MGLYSRCDIFQEKISDLIQGLEFCRAYIDDFLCINASTFEDHLSKLDKVLEIIQSISVKINTTKYCFVQPELEYLGHWITREGIMTTHKKVQEISNIILQSIILINSLDLS